MKKYIFDIHYDMVIRDIEIVAENDQEAAQLAKDKAARLPLESMECVGQDACISEREELTAEELRRLENEKVMEFVTEYVEQQTPTEAKDIADGYGVNWLEWVSDDEETAFYNNLFRAISNCEHPRTAIFERYARLYARQRWEEVKESQHNQFVNLWANLTQDKTLVIETGENLYEDNSQWTGNRYFMVQYNRPRTLAESGFWMLTRCGDEYCAPEDNIGWAAGSQYACRLTPKDGFPYCPSLLHFADALINAGRVLDIYTV